jgi:hypothetical protein
MNRLAEQVLPVMTLQEVDDLVQQHYRNEAQTLTKGAEANLLKFKELTGTLSPEEAERWAHIKRAFNKNLLLRSGDGQDPIALVVHQLSAFNEGLFAIKEALSENRADKPVTMILLPASKAVSEPARSSGNGSHVDDEGVREVSISPETLKKIWELVEQQNKLP